VDCAQVGVFKERHKVSLGCLLKSQNGSRLKSKVILEVLRNFPNKTLERKLADEKIGRLLVLADLTKSNRTGSVSVKMC